MDGDLWRQKFKFYDLILFCLIYKVKNIMW